MGITQTFGYLTNNSLLCTAFAQSRSREEILGMLRCNDKQFNNSNNGFN